MRHRAATGSLDGLPVPSVYLGVPPGGLPWRTAQPETRDGKRSEEEKPRSEEAEAGEEQAGSRGPVPDPRARQEDLSPAKVSSVGNRWTSRQGTLTLPGEVVVRWLTHAWGFAP